jgi:integrase
MADGAGKVRLQPAGLKAYSARLPAERRSGAIPAALKAFCQLPRYLLAAHSSPLASACTASAIATTGGLYADFHSMRHLFITSLERAGVSPKMAQTLARHSDIRLTLGLYTHVELPDRTVAIGSLPGPPGGNDGGKDRSQGDAA